MRKFINIVESASGSGLPDFQQFVTPALINELITTGLWTSHGSDVSDWWEEGAADYFKGEDTALRDLDFHSARAQDHASTAAVLERFVRARAGWIQRELAAGEHGGPLGANSPLRRAVMVNDRWLEAMSKPRKGPLPLGIYWGLGAVEPWGANFDDTVDSGHNHMVEIVTSVEHVHINWYETFRSRLDWQTGDDEAEVQLYPGSQISHIERITIEASRALWYQITKSRAAMGSGMVIPIHPSATFIA